MKKHNLHSAEPSPRWGHHSAAVGGQLYVFGGRTKDMHKKVSIYSFNQCTETWQTRGKAKKHPGVYLCACAVSGHFLYLYGGSDGSSYHDTFHQLDTDSLEWSQLPDGPRKKVGCGMVSYEDNKLILFGGYGISDLTRPWDSVVDKGNRNFEWTNELHIFDKGNCIMLWI